jgi:hypothetical protein
MSTAPDSMTCPTCHRTSHHPRDIQYGYCGACNWWTSNRGLPTHHLTLDTIDPQADTLRWMALLRDLGGRLSEPPTPLPTPRELWDSTFVYEWNHRFAAQAAAACAALTYTRSSASVGITPDGCAAS